MSEAPARRKRRHDITDPRAEYVAENGDKLKRENGKIWSDVRQKWLVETPEEYVRQEYLLILLLSNDDQWLRHHRALRDSPTPIER